MEDTQLENLKSFYNIVEILNACSIDTFKIILTEDNESKNMITGMSDDISHCVLDHTDETITSYNIGVTRSKILLNRMKLFSLDDTKNSLEVNGEEATKITLKQGNRTASYRFSKTSNIKTPIAVSSGSIISKITFDHNKFQFIKSAIQSMNNPEQIMVFGSDDNIWIKIEDDYYDAFEDVIGTNQHDKNWSCLWKTNSFLTLVQKGLQYNEEDELELDVSETSFGYISINDLFFLLLPQQQ